jgi:hypothetical protein
LIPSISLFAKDRHTQLSTFSFNRIPLCAFIRFLSYQQLNELGGIIEVFTEFSIIMESEHSYQRLLLHKAVCLFKTISWMKLAFYSIEIFKLAYESTFIILYNFKYHTHVDEAILFNKY